MDYALAKELKDAGFLQVGAGEYHYSAMHNADVRNVYYPTLDELIEACGQGFAHLARIHDGTWMAENPGSQRAFLTGERPRDGRGATITEAVARLWLSLNSK